MSGRIRNIFLWAIITLVIILCILNTILILSENKKQDSSFHTRLESISKSISEIPSKTTVITESGYIPQKGKDYSDGKNGKDGEKGEKGDSIVGKTGEPGKDAYIDLRCNTEKNRWEVRYSETENYQILNGEPVKCTISNYLLEKISKIGN